jgi:Uma2 family endonuclease
MSTATAGPRTTYTPDDLLALPDGKNYELVDGDLVEKNVSFLSSLVAMEIGSRLNNHCRLDLRGWVVGPDNGFRCFPGHPNKVRKPDAAVVLRGRITAEEMEEGFPGVVPDLISHRTTSPAR